MYMLVLAGARRRPCVAYCRLRRAWSLSRTWVVVVVPIGVVFRSVLFRLRFVSFVTWLGVCGIIVCVESFG